MKRDLSSNQTFLLKIILPIIFAAFFVATIFLIIFSEQRAQFVPVLFVSTFGILAMYFTVMHYKDVSVDDKFLYVSNYRKEIKIPVANIENVTEVKWIRTRPITIHLKNDSDFGRKIVFMPKFNGFRIVADNPMISELKELAKAERK